MAPRKSKEDLEREMEAAASAAGRNNVRSLPKVEAQPGSRRPHPWQKYTIRFEPPEGVALRRLTDETARRLERNVDKSEVIRSLIRVADRDVELFARMVVELKATTTPEPETRKGRWP